jgi:phytoene dehydrogenase-like protein
MSVTCDVTVIGSGINGLSAAALLAKSGKRVIVLESNDAPGGAIRTEEVTLPGFRHDLFAMNLGLFAGGPVMAALGEDLARHGFALVPSSRPFCSVFPDGTMIGVQTDAEATRASVAQVAPADVEAWDRLGARLGEIAPFLIGFLSSDLPSWGAVRTAWRAHRALGTDGVFDLIKQGLSSTRSFADENFTSPKTKALLASWGMHLDFAPDISGGALFSYLETLGGQMFGMVIGQGGASSLVTALVRVIEENGGEVRCSARVETILTDRGRAIGVRTASGDEVRADSVISNVNPRLMPAMLPAEESARPEVQRANEFRPGLATMMVHLALDSLPDWTAQDARTFNYVHIGPYMDDMARAYTDAAAGLLPERPTLVVGQPTVSDPSRAPEGKHVLWVQVRVLPLQIADGRSWDEVAEEYADRVVDIIDEFAPGIRSKILGRAVLSPADLQRYNANLIGGDSLGGSHHPAQFFFLRPVPGWGRHRAPVKNLYLCGASTWPGGGVGGTSGALVATSLGA